MLNFKHEFKSKYASVHALKSPAHITLYMPFRKPAAEESSIVRVLTHFAQQQSSFTITLNNFGTFSYKVIYIAVVTNPLLRTLQAHLLNTLSQELSLLSPHNNAFTPHITIATRDLRREMGRRAWEEFSTRRYSSEFTAHTISLLKHTGTHWEVHADIAFGKH